MSTYIQISLFDKLFYRSPLAIPLVNVWRKGVDKCKNVFRPYDITFSLSVTCQCPRLESVKLPGSHLQQDVRQQWIMVQVQPCWVEGGCHSGEPILGDGSLPLSDTPLLGGSQSTCWKLGAYVITRSGELQTNRPCRPNPWMLSQRANRRLVSPFSGCMWRS